MTEGSQGPRDPAEPAEPAPTGRSKYEDYDLDVPTPPVVKGARTPTLTVAAIVLGVSGALALGAVPLFHITGAAAVGFVALGAAEVVAAILVALLHPIGRPFGIVMACAGLIGGLASARSAPVNALISLALYGYVIYALASSGPSFRRG